MSSLTRRGMLKGLGGGGMAAVLAPVALKFKGVAQPALTPLVRPASIYGNAMAAAKRAAQMGFLKRGKVLQKILNTLRKQNDAKLRRKLVRWDHDIQGLRSVQPWAKSLMQNARDEEVLDILERLYQMNDEHYDSGGDAPWCP